jgi:hypothetical protein
MWFRPAQALTALTLLAPYVASVELDITQPGAHLWSTQTYPVQGADSVAESIKQASANVAKELWSYYAVPEGNGWHINGGYPGIIWEPYFWWQCGGMFGTLLDYWRYTGDSQYNDMVREGMIHQFGENLDLVCAWAASLTSIGLTVCRNPRTSPRTKETMTRLSGLSP